MSTLEQSGPEGARLASNFPILAGCRGACQAHSLVLVWSCSLGDRRLEGLKSKK
jgi:hypothetical protein